MYNVVESIHHLILLSIIDSIIEKNEKNLIFFMSVNFKI